MRNAIADPGKFRCTVDNPCKGCKWYQQYNPGIVWALSGGGTLTHIGYCKRYEQEDPDSGYVVKGKLPPCMTWQYARPEVQA